MKGRREELGRAEEVRQGRKEEARQRRQRKKGRTE